LPNIARRRDVSLAFARVRHALGINRFNPDAEAFVT
jgi:hypothetical protein